MNKDSNHSSVIDTLYGHLKNINDKDFGVRLSTMTDEQPYLMGFIFNLVDDFEEDEHHELVKASLVIRDVFVSAGMPINIITSTELDEVISSELERFNALGEDENLNSYISGAASPELLKSMLHKIDETLESKANGVLILNIIIRLMEEAAGNKEENK